MKVSDEAFWGLLAPKTDPAGLSQDNMAKLGLLHNAERPPGRPSRKPNTAS